MLEQMIALRALAEHSEQLSRHSPWSNAISTESRDSPKWRELQSDVRPTTGLSAHAPSIRTIIGEALTVAIPSRETKILIAA
jgi:hypothetical protein